MVFNLPNSLTALRIVLAPLFFMLFISADPVMKQISLLVYMVAALTDWYDGEIARSSGTVSNFGKFLDPLADKILTAFALVGLTVINVVPLWMVIVIIARDVVVTSLRVYAESRQFHVKTTRLAQWKTFVQMAVLYYLLVLTIAAVTPWLPAGLTPVIQTLLDPTAVYSLMTIVTAITVYTGVQYIWDCRHMFGDISKLQRRATG
ncbi:MAG: CDP-diacylglycerol--glycerol-3-phosphate 3-phosphatidyltransferase [Ectothiorhodospiraceae bacterium]|nr:CDP-diacylglycerol--glycerol-3-phosphate 3-phosphatidyltransferase [Ectothiorhodospiraceae bacterium]